MLAWFNMELMKKFIAPNLDKRPNADIPDLGQEFEAAKAWMQQYFLSSVFQGEYTGDAKLYAESIIARIQMAFAGYQAARSAMLAYGAGWELGNPGIGRYLEAVREWEGVFLNLQVIHDLLSKFMDVVSRIAIDRPEQLAELGRVENGGAMLYGRRGESPFEVACWIRAEAGRCDGVAE